MDYYVVYDMNDNIIAYYDNKYDLSFYYGIRVKDINYKFKNTSENFIVFLFLHKFLKIYRFFDFGEPDFEVETGPQNKMLNV